jgi:hypothetical protein
MSYICSVCGKSVTPSAFQYCTKKQYPVMCHKHQQEYGLNAYNVITKEEQEAGREIRKQEEDEKNNRTPEENKYILSIRIKQLFYDVRCGEAKYISALKSEIDYGKEFYTEEEMTKIYTCFNKIKNMTVADGKRIKTVNEKRVEEELRQLGKEYAKQPKGFEISIEKVQNEIDKITSKYPVDKKLNEWLQSIIVNSINEELDAEFDSTTGFAQYSLDNSGNESLCIY